MERLYCLFLDRSDIRAGLQTILTGVEYIKKGISICIFPEGTRTKDGKMHTFKEGSMKMASKTGCPIIPMAITNSAEIWENHFPKMKPCKVIVEYGAPIYPKELTKEEQKFLGAYVQGRIQEMLDAHQL
jgi:1-acyl-sn-glycerol-3-phosphate acyltransferase